jgi:hypothetical protein
MYARAACALFCCVLALPPASAQNAGVVEGSVVNGATRSGIAGVTVKLFTRQGVRYETTTDGTGRFNVHGMKEDEYDSSFEREGFAHIETTLFRRLLHVDGKNPARLDVEMTPYGKIRGRVVDAAGNPAANARVKLEGPRVGPSTEEITDNEGNFTFNKLLPGSYTVLAKPKPSPAREQTADNRMETVPTYFPSAIERAQTVPVIVQPGADASGNEIQLRTLPVYRVRGVVLDEVGKPAAKVAVGLHTREADRRDGPSLMLGGARTWYPAELQGAAIESTVTDGDGKFEFSSVRDGEWLLRAEAEWGYVEETKRDIQAVGNQVVSVSKKDVTDIRMRLATNFVLPLTVDFDDSPGTTGGDGLFIVLLPVNGGSPVFGLPAKKDANLLMDRTYPGQYRVMAQTTRPGFYIASMDYAGREISGQPIDIASGSLPMHVVLRSHAGLVRGLIEKGQAATVVLLAVSNENDPVRGFACAAGALFQFDNLRPGTYAIVAFDHADEVNVSDPAVRARLLAAAKTIRVEEGSNSSIELSVNRFSE